MKQYFNNVLLIQKSSRIMSSQTCHVPHQLLTISRCPPGTSDPYVKFKIAGKEVFRSRTIYKTLNPVWEEKVCLLVDTLCEPLYVKVGRLPSPAGKLQSGLPCLTSVGRSQGTRV